MAGIPRSVGGLGLPLKFNEHQRANIPEHWIVLDRSGTELSFVVVFLGEDKHHAVVISTPLVRPVRVNVGHEPHDYTMEATLDYVANTNHTTVDAVGVCDATHVSFLWLVQYGKDVLDVARADGDTSSNDFYLIDVQPWHEALDSKAGMTDDTKKKLHISYTRDALRTKMRSARSDLEIMITMQEKLPTEGGDSVVEKARSNFEWLTMEEAALEGQLDELQGRIDGAT